MAMLRLGNLLWVVVDVEQIDVLLLSITNILMFLSFSLWISRLALCFVALLFTVKVLVPHWVVSDCSALVVLVQWPRGGRGQMAAPRSRPFRELSVMIP